MSSLKITKLAPISTQSNPVSHYILFSCSTHADSSTRSKVWLQRHKTGDIQSKNIYKPFRDVGHLRQSMSTTETSESDVDKMVPLPQHCILCTDNVKALHSTRPQIKPAQELAKQVCRYCHLLRMRLATTLCTSVVSTCARVFTCAHSTVSHCGARDGAGGNHQRWRAFAGLWWSAWWPFLQVYQRKHTNQAAGFYEKKLQHFVCENQSWVCLRRPSLSVSHLSVLSHRRRTWPRRMAEYKNPFELTCIIIF